MRNAVIAQQMAMKPNETPRPMPIFAPELRPSELVIVVLEYEYELELGDDVGVVADAPDPEVGEPVLEVWAKM